MSKEFELKSAGELLSEPLPTDKEEASSLASSAAEILKNDSGEHLGSAAWRLADALALIAPKCASQTQGIDRPTGRGAKIVIKDKE